MELAGIDTSIFKAHTVRSALTSAASLQGVTTEDTVYREIFAALSFGEIKIREKYFRESYTCAIKGVA